ncbi:hypothetical protein GE09DRAFT_673092 [Coniochaeta sp. 2T2.1]|nr:hypothetical protein GE09DRAFT_673092 [Coniochaeta sp. 2T2.1]
MVSFAKTARCLILFFHVPHLHLQAPIRSLQSIQLCGLPVRQTFSGRFKFVQPTDEMSTCMTRNRCRSTSQSSPYCLHEKKSQGFLLPVVCLDQHGPHPEAGSEDHVPMRGDLDTGRGWSATLISALPLCSQSLFNLLLRHCHSPLDVGMTRHRE